MTLLLATSHSLLAQEDTLKENKIDSLLMRPKGILGQLTQSLLADTSEEDDRKNLQRADLPFQKYEDRIIRKIKVQSLTILITIHVLSSDASPSSEISCAKNL